MYQDMRFYGDYEPYGRRVGIFFARSLVQYQFLKFQKRKIRCGAMYVVMICVT